MRQNYGKFLKNIRTFRLIRPYVFENRPDDLAYLSA
jgi:hypothetical protein